MEKLINEACKNYDIDIKSIARYKDGFKLNTKKGDKYLKCMKLSPERVLFVHGLKEYIAYKGFDQIDQYILTKDNKPYMIFDNECYTVVPLLPGRECDFNVMKDVKLAARELANFHKASFGFEAPEGSFVPAGYGRLIDIYRKRLGEMRRLKNYAKKIGQEVDYIYLANVDFYYNMGLNAVDELEKIYRNETTMANFKKHVCHNEFNHRHILISGSTVSITDFETCRYEKRTYDVSELLRRRLKKNDWLVDDALELLEEYNTAYPLTAVDMRTIDLMLRFPYQFWSNANKYYNSKRCWSEKAFTEKMRNIISEKDAYINFTQVFRNKINELGK